MPAELLADLDEHVGEDGKFVNRSEAIRVSVRKMLATSTRSTHATVDFDDRMGALIRIAISHFQMDRTQSCGHTSKQ